MTPQEALGTLHNVVEQVKLTGPERDICREAAKVLQTIISDAPTLPAEKVQLGEDDATNSQSATGPADAS